MFDFSLLPIFLNLNNSFSHFYIRRCKKPEIFFFFQEAGTKELIEEKEENELDPLPSPEKFYDRSKSFFDNISCEAMGPKQDEQEYGDVVSARTLFFDIKKIK